MSAQGQKPDGAAAACTNWWLCWSMCAVAIVAWLLPQSLQLLAYDRQQLADGQLWRLLSGHLAHLNGWHLALNLAGTVLISELLWRQLPARQLVGLLLASAAAVTVGLWLCLPELQRYAGLSGVLHGAWAGSALFQFFNHSQSYRSRRRWSGLALLALALKLWLERLATFDHAAGLIGGVVVTDSHVYGAIGGLAYAGTLLLNRTLSEMRIKA